MTDAPDCPALAELRRRQAAPVERMDDDDCPPEWFVGDDAG